MKKLIVFILCSIKVTCFAQAVYEGQVVNSVTEETLPDATVKLLKANVATRTNSQGYYRLSVKKPIANDTLVFSFVGYKTLTLPVSAYQNKMFIKLDTAFNSLNQVTVKGKKNKPITLDHFTLGQVRDTRGVIFYATQTYQTVGIFAKEFMAPKKYAMLYNVKLARRDFDIPYDNTDYALTTNNRFTRFKVHVMVPNATGGPGDKIFTKELNLADKAIIITLDLSKDKIILPEKKFFVGIEWLPIPYNEIVRLDTAQKVEKIRKHGENFMQDVSYYHIIYQPILVKFEGYSNNPLWVAKDGVNWRRELKSPYRPHLENYLSIALSATISY